MFSYIEEKGTDCETFYAVIGFFNIKDSRKVEGLIRNLDENKET